MIKSIKEEKDSEDEHVIILNMYNIEVPVKISSLELNLSDNLIEKIDYNKLLRTFENYVNDNINVDNKNYKELLNNNIEIIGEVRLTKELLTINSVAIPKDLTETEIKTIMIGFLTDSYLSPYEEIDINVTPEEYNRLYAEDIFNGELTPKIPEKDKDENLKVIMELQLELVKIKIYNK